MSHMDLECGRGVASEEEDEEEEGSICFSDTYSTADGEVSYDEILEAEPLESRKASSMADSSDFSVDIDVESGGIGEKRVNMSRSERDCRICHLTLVSRSPGLGVAIELGCSCKNDLAAAHKHCAETWFKIKGNKTCEICNSIARNIVGANDIEALQQQTDANTTTTTATSAAASTSDSETRSCLNGHRFLNLLLACMVFAFVISWLFHFNMPS